MADIKFSQFTDGEEMKVDDQVVGLRAGANTRFDFPGIGIKDSNGNYLYQYASSGASAVNYLKFLSANTASPVQIAAIGSDTNIGLWLNPKGSGALILDVLTWPTADGTSGQVLTTNGSGTLSFSTPTTGTVTSVSGTANRITSTGGSTPVIDISAAYVGQASITTLGTVATGVWNGTAVTVPYGGTGNTTFTAYSVICGGTTATGTFQNVSGVGSSGQILTSNGAGTLPTWQTGISGLVSSVSGTANRITSTGGTTPVIDISASYVGQASITTLGTIGTGVWQGTVIGSTYGGTGVNNGSSTITIGGNVTFSGASTFTGTLTGNTSVTFPTSGTLATTAGTVSSVSGTANRITSTGGSTPVIDISASYVGQSSITTLGTIGTGVWNGTAITGTYGGTGVNNGASTITIGGNVTFTGGFTFAGTITGNTAVTFPTSGTLATTSSVVTSITGTANQIAASAGTGAVTLSIVSNAVLPGTGGITLPQGNTAARAGAAGSIRYNSQTTNFEGTNDGSTWTVFTTASSGVNSVSGTANRITSTGGTDPILDISASYVGQASITTLGTITTGVWTGTTIAVANGGTGLTAATAHYLPIGNGTSALTLLAPSATSGVALISQGSSSDPAYGTVVVAGGGTGVAALTAHYLPIGNGTSAVTLLAPSATSGVPLISQGSSSDPAYGTAVVAGGGTGVASMTAYAVLCGGTTSTGAVQSIAAVGTSGQVLTSNGAGALPTMQSLPSGAVAWSNLSGTTQTAVVNNGYVIGNSSQTTVTLPATAALGSIVAVQGKGAGGWILAANTSQTIQLGASATSSAGSLTSANLWDAVEVVCVTANTTWAVRFALSAGLTVA